MTSFVETLQTALQITPSPCSADGTPGAICGNAPFPLVRTGDDAADQAVCNNLTVLGLDAPAILADAETPIGMPVVRPGSCPVQAVVDPGASQATVRYELPHGWCFSQTFPNLPATRPAGGVGAPPPITLDALSFHEAYIYLTTYDHLHSDDRFAGGVHLSCGLNFVGKWNPTGVLGLFEALVVQPAAGSPDGNPPQLELILSGPIVFEPAKAYPALGVDQDVWAQNPPLPGITLQADLGLPLPLSEKLKSNTHLFYQVYTPITAGWLERNPTYRPLTAYSCQVELSQARSIQAAFTAILQPDDDSNLVLRGDFKGASVDNLAGALAEITGGSDSDSILPEEIRSAVGGIELRDATFSLVSADQGFQVISTSFVIGKMTQSKPWSLFGDLLQINLSQLQLMIFNPFGSEQLMPRSLQAEIEGELKISSLPFLVTLKAPNFYITAQLDKTQLPAGSPPLTLRSVFDPHAGGASAGDFDLSQVGSLSDLTIDDISLVAEPGDTYKTSLRLGVNSWLGSDSPWQFVLGFDLSNTGWQFSGSAPQNDALLSEALPDDASQSSAPPAGGAPPAAAPAAPIQGLPIGKMMERLAQDFNLGQVNTACIDGLVITEFSVAYDFQSKGFSLDCTGGLPIQGQNLAVTLTIDIQHPQEGVTTQHFSGQMTFDGQEFDLIFDNQPQATTFIAAYNDPQGYPVRVQALVATAAPAAAADIPDSLSFTLKDAFFAYQAGAAAAAPAAKPAEPGTVEVLNAPGDAPAPDRVKKFLFGLDIDGGLNLSDLHLPNLPLIGDPLPPDQSLKLSFQLLAGSDDFSREDVSKLNALLAAGPKLPDQAISQGANLTSVLQMGQESKTLALPVGFNKNTPGQSGADGGADGGAAVNGLTAQPAGTPPGAGVVTSQAPSAAGASSSGGPQWISLQKNFGPLHFERVGVAFKSPNVTALLDAALTAGGLTIALNGLSVSSPLTKFVPTFSLQGLGIDYANGPLEIGGAFLKQDDAYSGMVVIRTEALTISAIGSYTSLQNQPSLFIYAVLDYPLGGPAFFFVTGLAAGFGYNRNLSIPTIDDIATFPLVEEATRPGGPPSLPAGQQAQQTTLSTELSKLSQSIQPALGQNFLALGIKFTSFKIIDSFALLTIKFGDKLEFDLLGLSTLQTPPAIEGEQVTPIAEAQLALKATFQPQEGFLGVQAQLTSNSYILSKDCRLTGGFAFFCWFKANGSIRAGDFVLTLGGYHPNFSVPAHYPQVPPLGVSWQVDSQLSIKGDAYFALTPLALMAGGHLEALWHSDNLQAWFKAGADFIITWKPYHYDAHMYVDIGASYTFNFFGRHTISIDLGADLHLWGPDFAGTAEIHCYIFSVKVSFGQQSLPLLQPISWKEFKQSFLPAKSSNGGAGGSDPVCTISIQGGLVRQVTSGADPCWIVNPKEMLLVTSSIIPSTHGSQATGIDAYADLPLDGVNTGLAVAPMGLAASPEVSSRHTITIVYQPGTPEEALVEFCYQPVKKSVPAALWGEPNRTADGRLAPLALADLNDSSKQLVENTLAGYTIAPNTAGETVCYIHPTVQYIPDPLWDAYTWEEPGSQPAAFSVGQAAWDQANADRQADPQHTRLSGLLSALGLDQSPIDWGQPFGQ